MVSLSRLPKDLQNWARSVIPPAKAGWTELRPIQAKALEWYRGRRSDRDLIVCAPTAMGKTEAVFLPLVGAMGKEWPSSFEVLYICPLRALIDQQGHRLRSLLAVKDRPVFTWHGGHKDGRSEAIRRPAGLLIITPESLETILRGPLALQMFAQLSAVVVDELHAFFDSERGMQVITQLARLDAIVGRPVARFGLSATLSHDAERLARTFLRPASPDRVDVIGDTTALTAVKYTLRTFTDDQNGLSKRRTAQEIAADNIAEEFCVPLVNSATPTKTLMFCNSRALVEWMTDRLRDSLNAKGVDVAPLKVEDIIFAHHGSLDSKLKRAAEASLKRGDRSAFAVSSPTLELGLDIGEIERVIQINPGPTVASLRQRLGRSGRRSGKVSELVMIVLERRSQEGDHPLANLHLGLFQALAQLRLAQEGQFEAPDGKAFHLSTFIQQVLSLASREGGVSDVEIIELLIDKGPFSRQQTHIYQRLLDRLTRKFEHDNYGPLLTLNKTTRRYALTSKGEEVVRNSRFGTAFKSGIEYIVKSGGDVLGRLPAGHGLRAGDPICFAGQRWIVQNVVEGSIPMVLVRRSAAGRAPRFAGDVLAPSALVVSTMRDLYNGDDLPDATLSEHALRLIARAKTSYGCHGIADNPVLEADGDVVLFPWTGQAGQVTLIAALRLCRMHASMANIAIIVHGQTRAAVLKALKRISEWQDLPAAAELATNVKTTAIGKHDRFLGPSLQRANYASARMDVDAAKHAANVLAGAPIDEVELKRKLAQSEVVNLR